MLCRSAIVGAGGSMRKPKLHSKMTTMQRSARKAAGQSAKSLRSARKATGRHSRRFSMFQNDNVQKWAKVNMDASMKSFDLMTKNIQTIATEMTDYTKRSVENSTKAL